MVTSQTEWLAPTKKATGDCSQQDLEKMAASCGVVKKIQAIHILSPTVSEWTSAYRLSDSFSSHAWPVPWLDLEDAIYSAFAAGLTDSDDVMGKAQQRVKAETCWDLIFVLGTFNHGHVWRVVEQWLLETNTWIIGCWVVWFIDILWTVSGMLRAQIFSKFSHCAQHQELQDIEKALQDALESTDCLVSNFYWMEWWSWEFVGS